MTYKIHFRSAIVGAKVSPMFTKITRSVKTPVRRGSCKSPDPRRNRNRCERSFQSQRGSAIVRRIGGTRQQRQV